MKDKNNLLYGWEIISFIPDIRDNTKDMRCISIIAANNIEQVWEWLRGDRADERTEIISISRFGPILQVLDLNKEHEN